MDSCSCCTSAAGPVAPTSSIRDSANCSIRSQTRAIGSWEWMSCSNQNGKREMDTCNQSPGDRQTIRAPLLFGSLVLVFLGPTMVACGEDVFIRASQVGYWINETKVGVAFSKSP